jgi:peptidoglycan/LPS O-acetylase OafA/YrhL/glycosyltransferase involved in cell wall biosynthesis
MNPTILRQEKLDTRMNETEQSLLSPKPLRVCVIAPSLDLYGGQSIQAARLIEGLNLEPGIEAELLPINPRLPGLLRRLQCVKYVRTVVTEIAYLFLLLTKLWRFDVIHVFSASYFSFVLAPTPAVLIAKLFGKPIALNYHSGEAEDHLHRWKRSVAPIFRLADRIVAPSDFLVDIFARFGIKAEAISNTVDLDRFTFRERRPLCPVLLSNRNLETLYNVGDILRAFRMIEEQIPEAKLIVAGDGNQREVLKSLAVELGLKQVEFLGAVAPARMPAVYNSADVFINASLIDNMPLSIIEAFACGLSVVSAGTGGIPHIVADGRNGLLVTPGDYRALAQTVVSLLENQEKAAAIIALARNDSQQYTWEAVRAKWSRLYSELANTESRLKKAVTTVRSALSGIGRSREEIVPSLQAKLARSNIPALDGVRAIAVFLVIFYHFGLLMVPGGSGVMMFFVLSGFLITWLLLKENDKYGNISLKGFYRRRILRIFPAFYVYLFGLIFLLLITGKRLLWPHAIASFFYLTNYYNAIFGDPNTGFSHAWSLAIEEQFYLLWPFFFSKFRQNLKKMTGFLVLVIAGVWIHRIVLYYVFNGDQAYFYASFDTRMDSLMVGCLLAVLLKRGVIKPFWEFICSSLFMPLITISLLAVSIYFGGVYFIRYRDIIGFAIDPLLIALLIVQLISLSSTSYLKWIDWPVVRYLGRISYSLYLYQQITLDPVRKILSGKPLLAQLIAAVAVTIIIASISYYAIERPFLRLKDAKLFLLAGQKA